MCGGLESCCVGRVYGADGAVLYRVFGMGGGLESSCVFISPFEKLHH